ncbi:MAG: response regulator [Drouetiella hepatica Uher 2000/2452]|jgi:CheY-like chemotaxis protein/HPt (histidine-containing phosphotransfer) domain-containing protein|uniref:Response regulator n=1 Tax=Drouetiella hepatica Uher 2000/2452 TaxID=904376 RepID=A0A951UP95_9CYAN|nr:response regulator [Drouetiella hepatica Uher 2000/2452]
MTYLRQRTQNPAPLSAIELSPLKILLVEDNLTNQKVALKQLQTLGYQAEAVLDGQKAVEAITQLAAYELVLMDCQMPVMDGYEATQAIRDWESQALEPKNRIIIIAMTASDLPQDRERSIAAGMDDFVSKPVRRDALADVLQRWSQLLLANQAETGTLPQTSVTQVAVTQAGELGADASDLGFLQAPAPEHLDLEHLDLEHLDLEHLDLEHLHLLSDNSPEFELELLQLFVTDCTAQLEQLHQAIATQNLCLVNQTAHHIKGASANVGAKVMQFAADQIETWAYRKHLDSTDPLLDQLSSSLHHIKEFVDRHSSGVL